MKGMVFMKLSRREFTYISGLSLCSFLLDGCKASEPEEKSSAEEKPSENKDEKVEEQSEKKTQERDFPYKATVNGAEVITDDFDKKFLSVSISFTNNSDEADCFLSAYKLEAFQDSKEISYSIPYFKDHTDSTMMDRVKPGRTIEVKVYFELKSTSDVEVELHYVDSDKYGNKALFEATYPVA